MSIDIPDNKEQRLCQRLNLDFLVSVEHPDGTRLDGITIDLSLGGLKVACESVPQQKWADAEVTLMLLNPAFPETPFECKVQRLENKLMALSLAKSCVPRFGLALGKDQFRRASGQDEG